MTRFRLQAAIRLPQIAGSASVTGDIASSTGGSNPYVHYPSLDLALAPFTVTDVAATPTTSGGSTGVGTLSALQTALAATGPLIHLTADIDGLDGEVGDNDIVDADIVLNGFKIKNLRFGNYSGGTQGNRLRIRGGTVGSYVGGQLHNVWFQNINDLIVEGCDLTGPTENQSAIRYFKAFGRTAQRCAIHNCKAGSGSNFFTGDGDSIFIVGNSILTGMGTYVTYTEAWGIRIGGDSQGQHVIAMNDNRSSSVRGVGDSHMRLRIHPNENTCRTWVYDNRFLNNGDGRFLWSHSAAGNGLTNPSPPPDLIATDRGDWDGYWCDNNEFISNASGTSIIINDQDVATFRNNTSRASNWGAVTFTGETPSLPGNQGSTTVPTTTVSGNTELGYSAPGSWRGPGDPSGLDWTP